VTAYRKDGETETSTPPVDLHGPVEEDQSKADGRRRGGGGGEEVSEQGGPEEAMICLKSFRYHVYRPHDGEKREEAEWSAA